MGSKDDPAGPLAAVAGEPRPSAAREPWVAVGLQSVRERSFLTHLDTLALEASKRETEGRTRAASHEVCREVHPPPAVEPVRYGVLSALRDQGTP